MPASHQDLRFVSMGHEPGHLTDMRHDDTAPGGCGEGRLHHLKSAGVPEDVALVRIERASDGACVWEHCWQSTAWGK